MIKNLLHIIIILSFATILASCAKNNQIEGCTHPDAKNYNPEADEDDGTCIHYKKGCTDPKAINYNPDAEKDNGTCEYRYQGGIVFWYDRQTSIELINRGINTVSFYFDSWHLGVLEADSYWAETPEVCDYNFSSDIKELGDQKSKSYEYEVIDYNYNVIWSGTVTLEADKCLKFELKF